MSNGSLAKSYNLNGFKGSAIAEIHFSLIQVSKFIGKCTPNDVTENKNISISKYEFKSPLVTKSLTLVKHANTGNRCGFPKAKAGLHYQGSHLEEYLLINSQ